MSDRKPRGPGITLAYRDADRGNKPATRRGPSARTRPSTRAALLVIITDLMAALEASGVELLANYLFVLKVVVVVLAALMLVSGLDDLAIDIVYWIRRAWRAVTVFRRYKPMDASALAPPQERPMAIMVPAWHETGVIGHMAELAASTLEYENYHIFVGTYPNDPDTQSDVDQVCARFPNVHKVVCARPGPTSKADCLNNVLDAILQFERIAQLQFAGFILHDAEDVVCKEELLTFLTDTPRGGRAGPDGWARAVSTRGSKLWRGSPGGQPRGVH